MKSNKSTCSKLNVTLSDNDMDKLCKFFQLLMQIDRRVNPHKKEEIKEIE